MATSPFGRKTLESIPVSDLKRVNYNASGRVTDARLESLREEVRENGGVIEEPISVSSDLYIATGHRRATIATENGQPSIRAWVYWDVKGKTAQFDNLFRTLNKGNAGYTPKDRLWTVLSGGPAFTTQDQGMATRIKGALFPEEFKLFMAKQAPRDVFMNSRGVVLAIFHPGKKETDPEVKRDINKVLAWTIRHGQVQNLKHFQKGYRSQRLDAVKIKFDPAYLRKCVDDNKPAKDFTQE